MSKLDRYLLARLMAHFGFFALVLVAIYWLNQAVLLFNRLVADGQSARVVLELTSLALPVVVSLMLPLAAFAASLYLLNRLIGESELVVMQATGASPFRLARPVLAFGLIVAVMMSMLLHMLVPLARAQSVDRRAEIADNIASRFLLAGEFQHPLPGVTFFIRDISERGELLDIYLSDNRGSTGATVFLATKAVLVRSDTGPKLVMLEGMAQNLRTTDERLAVTHFSNFTYDLGALIDTGTTSERKLEEQTTPQLLAPGNAAAGAEAQYEIAKRVARSLNAPVSAMIGFAALLLGGFNRLGLWRQIGLATMTLVGLQFLNNVAEDTVAETLEGWPMLFAPMALGAAIAVLMLWQAGRSWRRRPGMAMTAQVAS
ncbi:LPS export ABC transporter permease LptF [Phaeovulum sp.]|uniref:LPS export ABC transporter permease LptF n=1 Tax=Phaeovulum sp. TaxID=2934796 RepID=UPI0035692AC6